MTLFQLSFLLQDSSISLIWNSQAQLQAHNFSEHLFHVLENKDFRFFFSGPQAPGAQAHGPPGAHMTLIY